MFRAWEMVFIKVGTCVLLERREQPEKGYNPFLHFLPGLSPWFVRAPSILSISE